MLIGLGVTLLACYTVLPAILRLRTRAAGAATPLPGQTVMAETMKLDADEREPLALKK